MTQGQEKSKELTALTLNRYLKAGGLGINLAEMAFTANRYGLKVNRQTLHNWYHKKHLPSANLLELYLHQLRTIRENQGTDDAMDKLYDMIQELHDIVEKETAYE